MSQARRCGTRFSPHCSGNRQRRKITMPRARRHRCDRPAGPPASGMLRSMQSPSLVADGLQAAALRVIVLTGFMGAGKTTVGRLLAGKLGWKFCDLDAEIERETGMTIAGIFRAEGEAAFRTREVAML